MAGRPQHEVTGLLQAWRSGDRAALDHLISHVHAELHRLAHVYVSRELPGQTLQTSALVNEAYLRLIDASQINWQDRAHFFAVAATIMRQVLIQYARARQARKRGGGAIRVEFSDTQVPSPERDTDLIALDDALKRLAQADPREAKVVELLFFGGLTESETAHVLEVSDRTVRRDWDHARAWLARELKHGASA